MIVKETKIMKITIYRKFNTIISFWLVAVIALLCMLGFKLDVFAFYIAASVVAVPLLATNIINFVFGIISSRSKALQAKREYN